MIDLSAVKAASHGQWPTIWEALGVCNLPTSGKHGPCPGCGGRDRFRLIQNGTDDGRWICGQGGAPTGGDGFALLCHVHGWQPIEAFKAVAGHLGITDSPEARKKAWEASKRRKEEKLELALVRELRVLLIVLENRVVDQQLSKAPRFRKAHPEWTPLPADAWQREIEAAARIPIMLKKLYPLDKRSFA